MSNFYDEGKKIKGQWEFLDTSFIKPSENCDMCDNETDLGPYTCSICLIDTLSGIPNVKYTDDCEWIIKRGKIRQFNKTYKKI